jgi:hypothetical protein
MPRRCVSGTAIDVVDEIGEADFHGRSRDADGANEQIRPALLLREHMLGLGADFRFGVVGAPDRAGRAPSAFCDGHG